jgi:preprotein translocase SecE subunit
VPADGRVPGLCKRHVLQPLIEFVKESYQELKKCTWPGRKEIQMSSLVVLIVTVIFVMIIFSEDWVIGQGLKFVY